MHASDLTSTRQGNSTERLPGTRRESLSTLAYQAVLDRLRRGLVGPEERLVDLDIAEELGVSRMPVREAFLQLVAEGYLVSTTRGYQVPKLSRQDVTEIFEIRRLLEPRAAALAARDLTPAAAGRLAQALSAAHQAVARDDPSALFRANLDFRDAWLGAVRNTRLAAMIWRYVDHAQLVHSGGHRHRDHQRSALSGLIELNDAMVRRDSIMAEESMRRMIDAAERFFTDSNDSEQR